MESGLDGKVALVTGSSRGIGAAIAQELSRQGCGVMLTGRSEEALKETVSQIKGQSDFFVADLSAEGMPGALVSATVARFGRIDIVVANAGATKGGDFLELSDTDWHDGFALKFFAHMRLIRAAWPHLKASSGSVVIISGTGGRTPDRGTSIGSSVNAALYGLAKSLADRGITDGIQVNAINPGNIRTDRFGRRLKALSASLRVDDAEAERQMVATIRATRIGEPADIAGLVSFIVGSRGSFLHGAIIDMDGGETKTV